MVLKLEYKDESWDVALPTLRSYHFEPTEIKTYLEKGGNHPLILDTNIINGCNTNCTYCATQGGKHDVRYPKERSFAFVADNEYKEVIRQLPDLGVRTFFICSTGEPLLNPKRFIAIAREAYDRGIRVITYTNGTTLTGPVLRELEEIDVNLVMKLESLDPETNDAIILNTASKRKKSFEGYTYTQFKGYQVPDFIPRAFDVYDRDISRLGLETMIINANIHEVVEIRNFAYNEFDCVQLLKHVYPLGYAHLSGQDIQPTEGRKTEIDEAVKKMDTSRGFRYPTFATPDHFSFDARRLINNLASASGFPLRIFGHERRGVYHSSQLVKRKLGFGTDTVIELFDEEGAVNIARYFEKIAMNIGVDNVWKPKAK